MYYNIFTGWMIAFMSIVIAVSLLKQAKNREILFFAGFWVFSGITFFANQLNEFFWLLTGTIPNEILHPVNQASVALQGAFLFLFVLLQLTKKLSLTKKLFIPVAFFIMVFYYLNRTSVWDGPVITDWSVEFYPTTSSAQLSFILLIGIAFVILLVNLIRGSRNKINGSIFHNNMFLSSLAILFYIVGGALDELGAAIGWQSLVIRGVILIGVLIGYFCYKEERTLI